MRRGGAGPMLVMEGEEKERVSLAKAHVTVSDCRLRLFLFFPFVTVVIWVLYAVCNGCRCPGCICQVRNVASRARKKLKGRVGRPLT